ncbi:MAG: hypothetical protein WC797_03555, partial [Candidatus Paceibacterota bacterium]
MQHSFLKEYKKDGLLHAYLIVGDIKSSLLVLEEDLRAIIGNDPRLCPDVSFFTSDTFTVDDARKVKIDQSKTPLVASARFFVLGANSFTEEAQNALLKSIEEPVSESYFFILADRQNTIISTLLSRLAIVKNMEDETEVDLAEQFWKGDISSRLVIVAGLLEEGEETELGGPKSACGRFLNSLVKVAHNKLEAGFDESIADFIGHLLTVKDYASDPSFATKMALEYLALTCPR